MTTIDPLFVSFHNHREKLQDMINRSLSTFESLDMNVAGETSAKIAYRLKADSLKVLIVGQFKQGKSTLINALLGEEVLPAFAVPCTAVINEIKFGAEKRAVVHFRSPMPETLAETLSPEARRHIESHRGNVPPLEIRVDEIQKYVVIPDPAKDHGSSVSESPFSLVEIFWPIDLCRNSVEIIDSPGLNEHGTRTRVTTDYLSKVDAVVFVLSCLQLAGQKEIEFVEDNLRASGHEEIIFACNRFDQVSRRDRQQIVEYGHSRLDGLTNLGGDGVFFLSAADALDGRVENDIELLQGSGVLELESTLAKFLVESRGKLKLLQPARQLLVEVNRAIGETIPSQLAMLTESTAELQRRHDAIQPQVEATRRRCEMVLQRVAQGRDRLQDDVRVRIDNFIFDVVGRIQEWSDTFTPKNEFRVVAFTNNWKLKGAKTQAESLATEVAEHINTRISRYYSSWAKDSLTPLVQQRITEITEGVEYEVEQIVVEIDAMKNALKGNVRSDYKSPGGLERFLAGGAGLLIADVGSAYVGATLGTQEMLKSLGPAIAVMVGSIVLGITNPVVLIGMLFTTGFLQSLLKAKNIGLQIKNSTSQQIASDLRTKASSIASEGASAVYQKTGGIQRALSVSMENELRTVNELIESVLAEKKAGDLRCRQRAEELATASNSLKKVQTELMDLILAYT